MKTGSHTARNTLVAVFVFILLFAGLISGGVWWFGRQLETGQSRMERVILPPLTAFVQAVSAGDAEQARKYIASEASQAEQESLLAVLQQRALFTNVRDVTITRVVGDQNNDRQSIADVNGLIRYTDKPSRPFHAVLLRTIHGWQLTLFNVNPAAP